MADTQYTSNIYSGFYDSVNQDRLYSAEDMNQPYRRLVSNGVFATQAGTPSTDFQCVAASGLYVTLKAGQAIIGDKWFSMPADLSVAIEPNSVGLDRKDSIIARVDTRSQAREGSIVYRTGTPASRPEAPSLDTTSGVYEFRLANVTVYTSATTITQAEIEDCRGSQDCPWVTSLVDQVDTSLLFAQWQSAYSQYYAEAQSAFNNWLDEQQQAWEDLLEQVGSDLSATNNVVRLVGVASTTSSAYTFDVTSYVSLYNPSTDTLSVYVNGLLLRPSQYTLSGTTVTLQNHVPQFGAYNSYVTFVVYKSLVASDLASVDSALIALDTKVSNFSEDSGWINLTLSGASAYDSDNTPAVRKVGNRIYLRGAIKGGTIGTAFAAVSEGFAPEQTVYLTTAIMGGNSVVGTCVVEIGTDGFIKITSSSASLGTTNKIPIGTTYSV